MKKIFLSAFALTAILSVANAQDNLVKKASETAGDNTKQGFHFTNVIDLSTTPIENQGSSGTCWSYSTNSFLESEMIKAGKKPLPLSPIYTARNQYTDKADRYVRFQGAIGWGDGGEPHDVINMYAKYGTIPEANYSGLVNGKKINHFDGMQKLLKGIIDSVSKAHGAIDPAAWKAQFQKVLDDSLGAVPKTFTYEGKSYTPQTFAKEVVGLDPDNYEEFISETTAPYYKKALMECSDDWAFVYDYNVTPTDLTDVIDNALKKGYTVAWGADVSEPYFNWAPFGVAFVPANASSLEGKRLTRDEKAAIFNGSRDEMTITPEVRQAGLDNLTTTDDHGMHIVGLAKDQDGKEFYIVKNSWGETNQYKGFLYVSKAYVQYKTTSILVNKKAIPKSLKKKLKG
ncbi:aminopeptidase [Arachidicoccus ginsenosidimutans]|uniref:aminopeptidase C n=1 Tax=Arachidicoccus sp. BS20 TaxID=1850526 RepID=UPI0007F175D5|nr:C1 family peptidase [Arachidicoccus sp. BS20]ANI87999.1 aminopeptidase [Arachidicoccus sp. BS20]